MGGARDGVGGGRRSGPRPRAPQSPSRRTPARACPRRPRRGRLRGRRRRPARRRPGRLRTAHPLHRAPAPHRRRPGCRHRGHVVAGGERPMGRGDGLGRRGLPARGHERAAQRQWARVAASGSGGTVSVVGDRAVYVQCRDREPLGRLVAFDLRRRTTTRLTRAPNRVLDPVAAPGWVAYGSRTTAGVVLAPLRDPTRRMRFVDEADRYDVQADGKLAFTVARARARTGAPSGGRPRARGRPRSRPASRRLGSPSPPTACWRWTPRRRPTASPGSGSTGPARCSPLRMRARSGRSTTMAQPWPWSSAPAARSASRCSPAGTVPPTSPPPPARLPDGVIARDFAKRSKRVRSARPPFENSSCGPCTRVAPGLYRR